MSKVRGAFLYEEFIKAKFMNGGHIAYALRNWLRLEYLLVIKLSICVLQGEIT